MAEKERLATRLIALDWIDGVPPIDGGLWLLPGDKSEVGISGHRLVMVLPSRARSSRRTQLLPEAATK